MINFNTTPIQGSIPYQPQGGTPGGNSQTGTSFMPQGAKPVGGNQPQTPQPTQPSKKYTPGGILPDVGGMVGGTVGQILGGTADFMTGGLAAPLINPMTAGAVLGGVGQGIGEAGQELMAGHGIDFGDIVNQAGQGALFGAIPGDPEANLGIKLATRLAVGVFTGGGSQILQNWSDGKPIDSNLLSTALTAGSLNIILPSMTEPLSKFIFGDANKITQQIATKFVGGENSTNADIVKSLDFANPEKSLLNLQSAQKTLYAPLQKALSTTSSTVGDFFNALTQQGRRVFNPDEIQAVQNALIHAEDVASTSGNKVASGAIRDISSGIQKFGYSTLQNFLGGVDSITGNKFKDVPIGLDAVNAFKTQLRKELGKDFGSNPTYNNIRDFIENSVSNKTDVAGINKQYHSFDNAINTLQSVIEKEGQNIRTGHAFSFGDRIGIMAGGALLGTMLHLPGVGGMAGLGGAALGADVIRNSMLQHGGSASKYLGMLGRNPLTKMAQQVGQRIPSIVNQITGK